MEQSRKLKLISQNFLVHLVNGDGQFVVLNVSGTNQESSIHIEVRLMRKLISECVGCCSLPCLGMTCPNVDIPVFYCDVCNQEIDSSDGVYEVEGKDLCLECLKNKFEKEYE